MNLETLQAKRALLVTQRDQLVANVNMTAGAIAMCDEMIAEELAPKITIPEPGGEILPEPPPAALRLADDVEWVERERRYRNIPQIIKAAPGPTLPHDRVVMPGRWPA